MIRSDHNFTHVMTAQLSWRVHLWPERIIKTTIIAKWNFHKTSILSSYGICEMRRQTTFNAGILLWKHWTDTEVAMWKHLPACTRHLEGFKSSVWRPNEIEVIYTVAGTILCVLPANERQCYNVTSSFIGWAHAQKDPRSSSWNRAILNSKGQRTMIWTDWLTDWLMH